MLLSLICFLEKRERIEFAVTVNKYDRRFKVGCCFDEILGNLYFNSSSILTCVVYKRTLIHSVCSESELTLFTGNEAGPSVIKQTHLPHWKRKGKYGERNKQRVIFSVFVHPSLSYAY